MDVWLQVESEAKGRLSVRLKFQDDGSGWPDEVLRGQSRHVGLRLIRISERGPLRGERALRNESGAVAEVSFRFALVE